MNLVPSPLNATLKCCDELAASLKSIDADRRIGRTNRNPYLQRMLVVQKVPLPRILPKVTWLLAGIVLKLEPVSVTTEPTGPETELRLFDHRRSKIDSVEIVGGKLVLNTDLSRVALSYCCFQFIV